MVRQFKKQTIAVRRVKDGAVAFLIDVYGLDAYEIRRVVWKITNATVARIGLDADKFFGEVLNE